MGVIFGWVVLAQITLCNGSIKIVSKGSPNFGCRFFGKGLKVVTIEIIEIVTTIIVTTFKRCNNLNML